MKTLSAFYLAVLLFSTGNTLAQSDTPVSAISLMQLESLQQASAQGSVTAMVELAGIYLTGGSGKREPQLAAELYRRAASLGDADATFHLGNMYLMGDGVAPDEAEAYRLFEQAAGQGHPLAIQNYESLRRSRAEDKQPEQTLETKGQKTRPATLDEIAAVQLARRHGLILDFAGTVDPTSAKQWVNSEMEQTSRNDDTKLLKQDGSEAMENIFRQAEQLYFGDGTAKDEAKAITRYRRAARAGHEQSITRLLAIYAAAGITPPRCGESGVADEICF